MQRNLYWPLCMLNVVSMMRGCLGGLTKNCPWHLILKKKKTVAPDNLCEISCNVGAL